MSKLKTFIKRRILKRIDTNIVKNKDAKYLELDKWAVSDFVSSNLSPLTKNRPFPLDELMLMTSAVCLVEPDLIFDWGTHIGKSARIFYEITKHFKITSDIHSVDLPDDVEHNEHPHETRGSMVKGLKNVTLHQGDGVKKSLAIYRASKAKKKKRVLFFIDGDHSYESVKRELAAIVDAIEHPAVLLHDTFYQSAVSGYNVGPHDAIKDILKATGKKPVRIDTTLGLPGMTLLIF